MTDTTRPKRPGDRVVRRRVQATQVITAPEPRKRSEMPSVRRRAKVFFLGLLSAMLVGTLILMLPWAHADGETTPVVDALFTAVSAASLTGLETVDTADHWSFLGELVILLLMQAGGLGFMIGAAVVVRALQRGQANVRQSVILQDGVPTLSLREARELVVRIIRFTLLIEAAGATLLTLRFALDEPMHLALWHGVFHAVSAFCNAGFDLQGDFRSFAEYRTSIWVNVVVMLLVQAGALSWIIFADIAEKRRWARLALETKIVLIANAALLLIGSAVFLGAEWDGVLSDDPGWSRPMTALFHSVTARTAGFATVDFTAVTSITLFTFVAIMFVGGASGSTAGGVKLNTAGVVFTAVLASLRGQPEPQFFGRRVPAQLVFRAMAVIALMFVAHFTATLAITIAEHFNNNDVAFISVLFETMSAIATVGLSSGITAGLTTASKLVLILTMIAGRIGPLTIAYALQRRQLPVHFRYPEAGVRIG